MNNIPYINTYINNRIATIEFYHPQANSMPLSLLEKLSFEIDTVSSNSDIKIILLKSGGDKTFCAGASFTDLSTVSTEQESIDFFSGFAKVLNSMRKSKKLIIGRVQGKAVGGGVGIISACDFVFATEGASVKLSELSIGIGPFVIAPALKRKIGISAFSSLTLYPEKWKTALWAKEKGLYNKVFDSIESLDIELDIYISKMASYKTEALEEIKNLLWEDTAFWEEDLYEKAKISAQLWMKSIKN